MDDVELVAVVEDRAEYRGLVDAEIVGRRLAVPQGAIDDGYEPGARTNDGVQEKAPLTGSSVAPPGAPGSRA